MNEREKIFMIYLYILSLWNGGIWEGKIFICVLFCMGMTDTTRLLKRPSTLSELGWINLANKCN